MTTCDRCGVSLHHPNNIIDKESVCTSCFQKEKEKMFEDTDSKEVKRDLKDDLKFCDRATQGPWEHRYNSEFSEIYANNSNASVAIVGHNPHDAEFIAQAREGWPHAIERAIKAETLVLELREALNKIAYPVRYLQNEADEKNFSLDGRVATELANSSHWLKSIAKEVLGGE